MNRLFKWLFLSVLTIGISQNSKAQNTPEELQAKQSADSLQRIKMKDSLQISDEAITQIFAIRDSMVQKINVVRSNSTLSSEEQDLQVSSIRNDTNESIKAILGDEKYLQYLDMIRNSLRQRNKINELPLAGETIN